VILAGIPTGQARWIGTWETHFDVAQLQKCRDGTNEFIYRHGERELKGDQALKIWLMKRTWSLMLGSPAAADHGDGRGVEAEAVRWATSNKDWRLVQFGPPRGGDVPVW
jgi:hypothetical protein